MDQAFRDAITAGYVFDEPALVIGSAMHKGELFNDVRVSVPMSAGAPAGNTRLRRTIGDRSSESNACTRTWTRSQSSVRPIS